MTKGIKNVKDIAIIVAMILLSVGIVFVAMGGAKSTVDVTIGADGQPVAAQLVDFTPIVTVQVTDFYNKGTAVTSKLMWRIKGGELWTNIANGGTIQQPVGTTIELVVGIDTTDETAEPYGETLEYEFIAVPNDTLTVNVRNDALATELTGVYFDRYDVVNTAQAWTAGDEWTLGFEFSGPKDKDFGNINVGTQSNVVVIKYNKSQIAKIEFDSILGSDGTIYDIKTANRPELVSTALGTVTYEFPVLQSSTRYKALYTITGDDDVAVNTTITALTIELYDSNYYLDNDDNVVLGGVEDEDKLEIGAAATDTITPSIGA